MRQKFKYIVPLILGLLLCFTAEAQRQQPPPVRNSRAGSSSDPQEQAPSRSRVLYKQNYLKQNGDSLLVNMDIDMSNMSLSANRAQILTPVLGSGQNEIELPRVMIQGTARNKAFTRELELDDAAYDDFVNNLPYAIVKPNGRLNYTMAIPFEAWMYDAYLDVEEDLCGCGDQSRVARTRVFDSFTKEVIAEPVYRVNPQLAFIQPEVEEVKNRKEIENAYLDFQRGKSDILPNFRNNSAELGKIDQMIRTISSDKDITVQSVYMIGYASPESSLKFNTELSSDRAEAMRVYFMHNSSIPSQMFETRTGGEDWEGFAGLLEEFPIPNTQKNEIFYIMNTMSDLDARENAISKVAGGNPYKLIYEQLYPRLRRVVCEVQYTVRDFSLAEAKNLILKSPHLLSLNEMYIVANTYQMGSAEFIRVFEIAREEFPLDAVANLNGAAAALSKGNFRDAERYLKLSDPSTPEYANNMGVFMMLRGDYREAERYLKQAESIGIPEATPNLRELRKKVENATNRREAGVDENGDEPRSSSSSRRRMQ